jgi:DNA-3-methyladenine glycosylase
MTLFFVTIMPKLSLSFYQQPDVLDISRQLLGKYLFTCFDNALTGGMIIETEAYRAPEDRASHAYKMRRTKRNEIMYHVGGVCYVYLCYGIYSLLNVVTNQENIPHAILIRALEPIIGIEIMRVRRHKQKKDCNLTKGPGTLTQALGINLSHNGLSLMGPQIWIEDRGVLVREEDIMTLPRVGIDYAGEDALLPWRFLLKTHSKKTL